MFFFQNKNYYSIIQSDNFNKAVSFVLALFVYLAVN